MMVFADLLHSETLGNPDDTGKCSPLPSPHRLHFHCRGPVYKRLHAYREESNVKNALCFTEEEVNMCKIITFTSVADSSFLLTAILVVPLGCVHLPLDINLHAVLTDNGIGLLWRPVPSVFRHLYTASIKGPFIALFPNAYPVISGVERKEIIEKVGLLLAAHGYHACEVLLAPLARLRPPAVWSDAVVVGPCLCSSSAAQLWDEAHYVDSDNDDKQVK